VAAGSPPYGHSAEAPETDFGHVIAPSVRATHSFKSAPALDVLFVPGGAGIVALSQDNDTSIETFINLRYPNLEYLVGISYGVTSLARSGVLNGKKATTNKSGWQWVTTGHGENITWVPQARWVEDGNIWTTSGMSSGTWSFKIFLRRSACLRFQGLDATYALCKKIYGTRGLNYIMNVIEYAPHLDPTWDPYASFFNVSCLKNWSFLANDSS
jgi:putative intracellular protease/amidase